MDVSVVIVDWHQPVLTRRAVESVLSQRVDASVEVVLVVNEADEATVRDYRADFPSLVVVPEPTNAGFAGGVARGMAASTGGGGRAGQQRRRRGPRVPGPWAGRAGGRRSRDRCGRRDGGARGAVRRGRRPCTALGRRPRRRRR
ncbi:glycosyltransferase [Curtobacterium sp. MCJR17_043]|uniref:glycosyltransferase family 2 protein n=1 Tax=Curtobacterium sp. MCJR17_043 TaxID=2175660 RepID=UPI0024E0069C|nr:glycosyltransferase [Curtobacterium sp. MCJR17_043]WIB35272.1 glycosyltransferase [Curtobacterium sp. MCJR17_043]